MKEYALAEKRNNKVVEFYWSTSKSNLEYFAKQHNEMEAAKGSSQRYFVKEAN